MTNAHFNIERLKQEIDELVSVYGFDPYDTDDQDIWLSAIEGETSFERVLDRLYEIRCRIEADIEMQLQRINMLKIRVDRHRLNKDRTTDAMLKVLRMGNQKSFKTTEATFSIRAGSKRVEIEDEQAIPTQLTTVKTVTKPDRHAIKAALEAGEIVPGATLVTGEETLSVRTK